MIKLLRRHVMSELAARRFAWGAAFVLGAACPALVLKVLPEFRRLGQYRAGVRCGVGLGRARHAVPANDLSGRTRHCTGPRRRVGLTVANVTPAAQQGTASPHAWDEHLGR